MIEGFGERRFFCKYGAGMNHNAHGHRGGVSYEARVYRYLSDSLLIRRPTLIGIHKDDEVDSTWLVLEHLDDAIRVKKSTDPAAMLDAARWIARFHARSESLAAPAATAFLNRLHRHYFAGWASRAWGLGIKATCADRSLFHLTESFGDLVAPLLESAPVIIHGEYYPNNILYGEGRPYPIDWESAAISAGEIDIACLTDGWSADVVEACDREYAAVRWPDGPPEAHEDALRIARTYMHLRWLGDEAFRHDQGWEAWRIDRLHSLLRRPDREPRKP
jgi:aminoglycoside phosphotransferase (APT) family kinase protein